MSFYKIINITHTLGKRKPECNTILDIIYVENLIKKTIKIKPRDTVYISIGSLPLSVHRLRVLKLVAVIEVSEREVIDEQNKKLNKKKLGVVNKTASKKVVKAVKAVKKQTSNSVDVASDVKSKKKKNT